MEPRFCGLRVTTSLPSLTHSSPSPRDARLVHSTVPGLRIRNVLTTSSRDNHTASLSEMSLFTCSRVRTPTTTSCVLESDSPADSLVIETSEPPQGARVLTDERSRLIQLVASQLTQTELGGTVGEKAALFADILLRSTEEVISGQIRQSRISGIFKDKAMQAEFEEAWMEREEARKAVHGTLAGDSAFRALRKACRKLREAMQAEQHRYLEV